MVTLKELETKAILDLFEALKAKDLLIATLQAENELLRKQNENTKTNQEIL